MTHDGDTQEKDKLDISVIEKDDVKIPKLYNVAIHNDDYTTMDFVVLVLQKFFNKNLEEAETIMMKVHSAGKGICGNFIFEVAESKTKKVNRFSKSNGFPLKCSFERE